MSAGSLNALKQAVQNGKSDFQTLDKSNGSAVDISTAEILRINASGEEFNLKEPTTFKSSVLGYLDLRTVLNCWECRELSVADYLSKSDDRGISNLKFLERTDLIDWLQGSSTHSEYIEGVEERTGDVEMPDLSGDLGEAIVGRGTLCDHNSSLHGVRASDFTSVVQIAQASVKQNGNLADTATLSGFSSSSSKPGSSIKTDRPSTARNDALVPLKPAKGKDPIILLSPSPSSLLNMANVQSFLEEGKFVPALKSSSTPNLLRITRKSSTIGSRVRFVVVDSVDNFKPEYWDRVVAVFVTGQQWQLRQYKWTDAKTMFQHVLGFGLQFKNDVIPDTLKHWNVKMEVLERNNRFRDREVVERIWELIETYMVSRGWPLST